MASGKIKGIIVEIGGDTTKLGKAIADSESSARSLQGELRQVDKLLKFDPTNTELLAQKQKILTQTVEETKKKLDTLKEAEAQVIAQFEKGDIGEDQLRAFQREIIKTESELNGFTDQLDDTGDGIEDLGKSAENSGDGFTVMKGALADLVSNVIQGAISAIGDLIGSLFELSEATEEYRQMQAKIEGSANTFGYSAEFATNKYKEFYKYLGDDQMATNAITNLMGLGTSTDSVSKLAEGAIGVWSAYGDSIPIEGLTESINETIQVGKVTGVMADTINWAKTANEDLSSALGGNSKAQKAFNDAIKEGLPAEDAFNEALSKITDEQERADVVAQFLNTTYGDSKKTYDEMSGSILEANEAELRLKETQAELGEAMSPINTAFSNFKTQALELITPLIVSLAEGFMNLLNWLKEHPVAMGILTGVVTALAVAFGILAGSLLITGIINAVTFAIGLLGGAFAILTSPISLIVIAIAGLVAGFLYLWNNCEGFREFFINLWEGIKSACSVAIDAIVNFFTVTIPNAWNGFITFCGTFIGKIVTFFSELPGKIWAFLVNVVTSIATWATNLYNTVATAIPQIINNIVNFFASLPEKIGYAIGFVIGKLVLWGSNIISWVTTNIPRIITNIVNFFKELPGKIWTFLVNVVTRIATWGANMHAKATSVVTTVITAVITFFRELPGKIWNAITGAITFIANWGAQMKSKAVSAISTLVSNVVTNAKTLPSKIASAISGAISKVAEWGKNMLSKAKEAMKKVVSGIVDTLKETPKKVVSVGKDIVEGVWAGIKNATSWLKQKVGDFAKGILDGMKDALGIASPSKITKGYGEYIVEGLSNGIDNSKNKVIKSVDDMVSDIKEEITGKDGFDIHSPALWGENVGENLVEGIAIGIDDAKSMVTDAVESLVSDTKDAITEGYEDSSEIWDNTLSHKAELTGKSLNEMTGQEIIKFMVDDRNQADRLMGKLRDLTNATVKYSEVIDTKTNKVVSKSVQILQEGNVVLTESLAVVEGVTKDAIQSAEDYKNAIIVTGEDVLNVTSDTAKIIRENGEEISETYEKQEKDANSLKETIKKTYSSIAESCLTNIDDILKAQEKMEDKLSDFGNLYKTNTVNLGDKTVSYMTLGDLSADIEVLETYNDLLTQVRDRGGLPTEIFDMLRDMSIEEGISFSKALLNASDEDYNKFITDFQRKQDTAYSISKNLYSTEADNLATEITSKFDKVEEEFFGVGKDSADQFEEGFLSELTSVINTIKRGIQGAFNNLYTTITDSISFSVSSSTAMAKGGILTRPTRILAGEDGAEAIIPLEHNTQWVDAVARQLNTTNTASVNVNMSGFEDKLNKIYERLDRMQIVLDTGTLVGETIDKIDTALANKQLLNARGV